MKLTPVEIKLITYALGRLRPDNLTPEYLVKLANELIKKLNGSIRYGRNN